MASDAPGTAHTGEHRTALLAWYDARRRVLAWRAPPGKCPDPYHVWLSEIMLQQTTVKAVTGYFERFISAWPHLAALAAAPREDVMKAWAGLGYYARARNLHTCAQVLMTEHAGRFPDRAGELVRLPGIGPYTAGAIAAIAFNQPEIAVDGNVERVLSRLHAIKTPLPRSKPMIAEAARQMLCRARPGDFAQALMDLGATVCTPKSPACGQCPWTATCRSGGTPLAGELPRKTAKATRPHRSGTIFWLQRHDGAVLVCRRPDKGLLGGMAGFYSSQWRKTTGKGAEPNLAAAPVRARWQVLDGTVEHTFTHFHLVLRVACARVPHGTKPPADQSCHWVARRALDDQPLPAVMKKVARFVEAHGR